MKKGFGKRRQSRELALQVLYQADMTGTAPEESLSLYCEHFPAPADIRPFAELLVVGVHRHHEEIDRLIAAASEHWRMERMSVVDRSILRLAVYEMLYCEDIPPKVSINEAIDLGKRFSGEDAAPFINGILDQVFLQMGKPPQSADIQSV
jgi:N utilization substance protein B